MSLWERFCKGLYGENTRHVPLPARDPRPKGANKNTGEVMRSHQTGLNYTANPRHNAARTPWTPWFDARPPRPRRGRSR